MAENRKRENAGQWYAAAFHLGQLLQSEPNNEDLQKRLRGLEAKLQAAKLPLPAPARPEVLTVPLAAKK